MNVLPKNLLCLTLTHSLDDPDAVERFLEEFPDEMPQCIPIALRNILEFSYLPPVPFFSSSVLLEYLSTLWEDMPLDDKLIHAARNGFIYLVAHFLDQGANIHAKDDWALSYAVQNGHLETVRLLLDRGADVHADDDAALVFAVKENRIEINLLLDRGVSIHTKDDFALRFAAQNGYTDTVRLLLDRGANIHASNDYALRYAVANHHDDTVKLLLDRKANATVLTR